MGINFLNVAKYNLPNVSQHWCILHYLTCQRMFKSQNPTVCRSWHDNNLWTLLWALCTVSTCSAAGYDQLTCFMLHVLGRELVVVRGRGEGGAELWVSVCPLWWGGVVAVSRSLGGTDHLPPHNITLNLSAISRAASLPPILYHGPLNNIL